MSYFIGIDVGGTKTEVAIIEVSDGHHEGGHAFEFGGKPFSAKFLVRERMHTQRRGGYDSALSRLIGLCQQLLKQRDLSPEKISGIGIGLPGPVDPSSKCMVTGNSGIFVGHSIHLDLAKALNYEGPITCGNDANCFTLAEALAGAGYEHRNGAKDFIALGVILGTGVGGGFFINDHIFEGRRGGASEWGHMPFVSEGHPCYCGNLGCVEQYLSGPALEASFAMRMYSQIPSRPKSEEIFELAQAQDPVALAVVKRYKRYLAKFSAILSQIYDPDLIILGGGVSLQNELYNGIEELMEPYLFMKNNPPKIVHHKLGDSSGVLGAAFMAMKQD